MSDVRVQPPNAQRLNVRPIQRPTSNLQRPTVQTSKRPNVQTSKRPNVQTSKRPNVQTSNLQRPTSNIGCLHVQRQTSNVKRRLTPSVQRPASTSNVQFPRSSIQQPNVQTSNLQRPTSNIGCLHFQRQASNAERTFERPTSNVQ